MITLRAFRSSDAGRLVSLANNRAVTRFLTDTFPFPYTDEDAQWWIETGSKAGISRVIELDGELVGGIGAEPGTGEKRKQFQVGYWLGEPYWGKGIGTESLKMFALYLFEEFDVVRLQSWVYSRNIASMRVLQKAGFVEEAVLKKALYKDGSLFDEHVYRRLRPSS